MKKFKLIHDELKKEIKKVKNFETFEAYLSSIVIDGTEKEHSLIKRVLERRYNLAKINCLYLNFDTKRITELAARNFIKIRPEKGFNIYEVIDIEFQLEEKAINTVEIIVFMHKRNKEFNEHKFNRPLELTDEQWYYYCGKVQESLVKSYPREKLILGETELNLEVVIL